eukprot:2062789-Prymnesium_polylepis.1
MQWVSSRPDERRVENGMEMNHLHAIFASRQLAAATLAAFTSGTVSEAFPVGWKRGTRAAPYADS